MLPNKTDTKMDEIVNNFDVNPPVEKQFVLDLSSQNLSFAKAHNARAILANVFNGFAHLIGVNRNSLDRMMRRYVNNPQLVRQDVAAQAQTRSNLGRALQQKHITWATLLRGFLLYGFPYIKIEFRAGFDSNTQYVVRATIKNSSLLTANQAIKTDLVESDAEELIDSALTDPETLETTNG